MCVVRSGFQFESSDNGDGDLLLNVLAQPVSGVRLNVTLPAGGFVRTALKPALLSGVDSANEIQGGTPVLFEVS